MDSDSSDSLDSGRLRIDEDFPSTPTYGQSPSASTNVKSPSISTYEKSPSKSMYEKSQLALLLEQCPSKSENGHFSSTSTNGYFPWTSSNGNNPLTYTKRPLTSNGTNGYFLSTSFNDHCPSTSANGNLPLTSMNGHRPIHFANDSLAFSSSNGYFPLTIAYGDFPSTSTPAPPNECVALNLAPTRERSTRHKRSLTEGAQSTNSRRYKKFQNLPEDVAEIKRLKLNEQERDRQRRLCDVFLQLKELHMPNIPADGNKCDSKYHLLRCAVSFIKKLKQENADLKGKFNELSMNYFKQWGCKVTREQDTQTEHAHIDHVIGDVLENGKIARPAASLTLIPAKCQYFLASNMNQHSIPTANEHFLTSRMNQHSTTNDTKALAPRMNQHIMSNANEHFLTSKLNQHSKNNDTKALAPRMGQHAMPDVREHFLAPRMDQDIMSNDRAHLTSRMNQTIAASTSKHAAPRIGQGNASTIGLDIKVEIAHDGNDSPDMMPTLTSNMQPNYVYKTESSLLPVEQRTPHRLSASQEKVQLQHVVYPNMSAEDLQRVYLNQLQNPMNAHAWNSFTNNTAMSASNVPQSHFPPMACFAKKFYVFNNVMPTAHANNNPPIAFARHPPVEQMIYPPIVGVRSNPDNFSNSIKGNHLKDTRLVSFTLNTPVHAGNVSPQSSSGSDTQLSTSADTSSSCSDFETHDMRAFSYSFSTPSESSFQNSLTQASFNTCTDPSYEAREAKDGIPTIPRHSLNTKTSPHNTKMSTHNSKTLRS